MSRTDKDMPAWVTATRWKPYHVCQEGHALSYQKWNEECDLPTAPRRVRPVPRTWRSRNRMSCEWVMVWERRSMGSVPKSFLDHQYFNPERRRTRDDSRKALAEYRATGKVDVVHSVRQARGEGRWYYW